MGNHCHLVVETPRPNLACGMQRLNSAFARWFNERHGRVGHTLPGPVSRGARRGRAAAARARPLRRSEPRPCGSVRSTRGVALVEPSTDRTRSAPASATARSWMAASVVAALWHCRLPASGAVHSTRRGWLAGRRRRTEIRQLLERRGPAGPEAAWTATAISPASAPALRSARARNEGSRAVSPVVDPPNPAVRPRERPRKTLAPLRPWRRPTTSGRSE
jgi:hypothetical protein